MRKFENKDAPAVIGERDEAAKQELKAKGWLEARELVGGVANFGWEDLSKVAGGEGSMLEKHNEGADAVGAANGWRFSEEG